MPRTERLQKCAGKQLQDAAKASGQTSMSAFLQRPRSPDIGQAGSPKVTLDYLDSTVGQGQQNETDTSDKALIETARNSANLQEMAGEVADVPSAAAMCVHGDPWIKTENHFTELEKTLSVNKGRYFQADWFKNHEWIWYHREKRAVFCSVCTQHKQQHDQSPFIFSDDSSATGFRNWKKGAERLSEHERSDDHRIATTKANKSYRNIACELDKQVNELYNQRRQGLISHLNTLKTIIRQGIAVRGHTDEDSNIVQFNKDKAIDNPALALFLKENKYLGHDVLAEQEELLVLKARRSLLSEINSSAFYAIICDESSDISKTEQLSFSVRHCSDRYETSEDFIGVMPCDEGLTSEALLKYVKDIMVRCNMDSSKMISMAFDGASSMKHLASLLKTQVSKHALYIHCFAHCNELVFKDAASLSSIISDAQDFCESIYVLAGVSPKRVLLFQNVQQEMFAVSDSDTSHTTESNTNTYSTNAAQPQSLRLKNLSRTRWTTRGAAADVVLERYQALRETLKILSHDRSVTADCRSKSEGILRKLQCFSEMFKLVVMNELAALLENNSKQLQSASLTAEQASNSIDKMCIRLDELRTRDEFERLINKVETIMTITGLSVVSVASSTNYNCLQEEEGEHHDTASATALTKRKRKCPVKMTDFIVHAKTPIEASNIGEKAELMRLYFEMLDVVKHAAKSRFEQDDLKLLRAIESFIISAANKDYSEPDNLVKDLTKLSEIIDLQMLTTEVQELPVYIKLYNRKSLTPLKCVTKVSTICEILNSLSDSKECLPEIHKLLKLYMTVPLASATAERTFSTMRRVKSWLRSTMSSNTLNNSMFSTIHKQRMDEVSTLDVAKEFVAVNEQRMTYFGHFD